MTVAEVVAAVAARLAAVFGDVAVWDTPPNATALPAVWPEAVNGTGPGALASTTVRVVYVPAPRQNTVQHGELVAAVDRLHAAFLAGLPSIVTDQLYWSIDAVEVGGTAYDAVVYDLALSHHLTC